ncbi:MAG: hypothetical protein QOG89_584 [Thermomicrobiales bacterium]|nr:hypothetical protein [Thermomicrobiales bacterium]
MNDLTDRTLCELIIRANEANHAYFAERAEFPGVVLFTAERADASEFDLALIGRVAPPQADTTLSAVVRHFRERGRRPRVRFTPFSTPSGWADRLHRAGFVEADERTAFIFLPEAAQPADNPSVVVERAATPEDADRFSAIQVAGFGIPPEHREWDRELARRYLAVDRYAFYLASLDGQTVGAARSVYLPDGAAGLSALATLPAARGHGVGSSLLRRMADDARTAGCRVLFGTVRPDTYAAAYYGRMGWETLFVARTFATPRRAGHVRGGVS